jgi:hypothetical protein
MLIRNVRELLRHPVDPSALTDTAPLVVLNNFGGSGGGAKHIALMTSMLQGMFPTIDIGTVRLGSCQRVVLFHFDKVLWGPQLRALWLSRPEPPPSAVLSAPPPNCTVLSHRTG